jgi:hypothetical protein
MSIVLVGSTSGSVTLQEPAVAGTTVLTLPATTGTFITTTGGVAPSTAGNVLTSNGTSWTSAAAPAGYTNADVLTLFSATGSAPVYAVRTWINFNGVGTPAIRGSGNVSSITDNAEADYTVNFTTAMPDTNYSVAGMGRQGDEGAVNTMRVVCINAVGTLANAMTTTSVRVSTQNANGSAAEIQVVCVNIFR